MKCGLPGWPSGIALESELWAVSSNLSEDNRIQATHLRLVHDLSLKCVIVKLELDKKLKINEKLTEFGQIFKE